MSLAADFAALLKFPFDPSEDTLGLEFETSQHTVRVLPHPLNESHFFISVDVLATKQETPPSAWKMLLQLNLASIAEHDWSIGLEESGTLVLSRAVELSTCDSSALENLIVDGLDRAEALTKLWLIACGLPDQSPNDADSSANLQMVFLKA